MEDRLISIIMPAYDACPYLTDCLDSIVHQTYPNWELLVVDDHSTDDTLQILEHYAVVDPRIRVLHNQDKGILPALQLGYRHSLGRYITRMDADDLMVRTKLMDMLSALLSHKGGVAVGLVQYFSEVELGEGYRKYAAWLNDRCYHNDHFEHIYKECVIPSPNWMIRRTDFERCGGFMGQVYPEDYDLAFRMRAAELEVIPILKVLHHWRDHDARTSRIDPHYADNSFIPLKVNYFITQDYQVDRPLMLWGAGRRGKKIAKHLLQANVPFTWITNNPQKIGKDIYGVRLCKADHLDIKTDAQVIISVAGPKDQEEIRDYLKEKLKHEIYWFC